jgi:hypothetical protein
METLSPQQRIPRRRGRPRKNKEFVETKLLDELRARSIAEKLLMCIVLRETLEGTSQESRSRMRRMDALSSNDQETTQQLKQAKLSITELYQENRELRQQMATKITEASAAQGHEGNATWLNIQRWEVQDTIVQLHEAQRLSKERNAKHSRECEAVEEIARAALASEQKKTRLAEFFLVFTNKRQILEILKETSPKEFYHFSNGHDYLHPLSTHTFPPTDEHMKEDQMHYSK